MANKIENVYPIRRPQSRQAKLKANFEIKKYFQPKASLDTILENAEPQNVPLNNKLSKDKNNNKRQNSKRNFTELSVEQNETDEKETARDTKRKKDTSTHSKSSETVNETHAPQSSKVEIVTKTDSSATDRVTRLPSTSSSDLEITLDTSAASDSVILVDSSAAVNETNAFDALDTEDPTESEGDGQFNRPYWSLSTTRKSIVIDQIAVQMKIVDTFFGSKVESPRSIDIFPASKPIARRRSTAVWNTPPRYSMLPKY